MLLFSLDQEEVDFSQLFFRLPPSRPIYRPQPWPPHHRWGQMWNPSSKQPQTCIHVCEFVRITHRRSHPTRRPPVARNEPAAALLMEVTQILVTILSKSFWPNLRPFYCNFFFCFLRGKVSHAFVTFCMQLQSLVPFCTTRHRHQYTLVQGIRNLRLFYLSLSVFFLLLLQKTRRMRFNRAPAAARGEPHRV